MKKSEWLDCQRNEFFPKQKGIPSLVKTEHNKAATLDSASSEKKSKVAVLQLGPTLTKIPGSAHGSKNNEISRVCVFTGIRTDHRIGPEIGLFMCLTDFFLYKNNV